METFVDVLMHEMMHVLVFSPSHFEVLKSGRIEKVISPITNKEVFVLNSPKALA
jgi:hypothetical protein